MNAAVPHASFALGRRALLLGLGATFALGRARVSFAQAPGDRRLVVVILRGGLDGLFAVQPYGDPGAAELRGALMLPEPGQEGGLLDLGGRFGLHPAFTNLHALYRANEAMVVHAVFDAGARHIRNTNHPTMAWLIAHAFGNFFGAGVWGFMHTLPQINLYTHGTQWSASHGHLAFFGAYATIIIAFFYLAIQKWRGNAWMADGLADKGWKWKWSFALLNIGMLGMTVALLISGYVQSQIERAIEGSTWAGYFAAQSHPWFIQGIVWRELFGGVFAVGFVLLVWDLLTIGKKETRTADMVLSANLQNA